MVIMLYLMFGVGGEAPHDDRNHTNMTDGTMKKSGSHDHYKQIMITPGLDVLNLVMFILATPVQVQLPVAYILTALADPSINATSLFIITEYKLTSEPTHLLALPATLPDFQMYGSCPSYEADWL